MHGKVSCMQSCRCGAARRGFRTIGRLAAAILLIVSGCCTMALDACGLLACCEMLGCAACSWAAQERFGQGAFPLPCFIGQALGLHAKIVRAAIASYHLCIKVRNLDMHGRLVWFGRVSLADDVSAGLSCCCPCCFSYRKAPGKPLQSVCPIALQHGGVIERTAIWSGATGRDGTRPSHVSCGWATKGPYQKSEG